MTSATPPTPRRPVLRRAGPWRTPLAIALALLLGLAMLAGTELTYRRALDSLVSLGGRDSARNAAQTVVRSLLDMESAQRGYLLTGRPQYLDPYKAAGQELDNAVRRLREHHRHDPELLALVERLNERALEKVSEIAETVACMTPAPTAAGRA